MKNINFVEKSMETDSKPGSIINSGKVNSDLVQYAVLFLFVALYIFNVTRYFWTLPVPSDPLQYLGPVTFGSTWAYWPWLDRINLGVNLRIFTMFFSNTYVAGMVYIGFINTVILIVSMIWAFKKSGFWASLLAGIFINSSFLMLGWSTYIYPDQTVALYALLAFIAFFRETHQKRYSKMIVLAGIFAAFASFTKATGVVIPIFLIGYCIFSKEWQKLFRLVSGIIFGSFLTIILYIGLFDWQSFINTIQHFFKTSIPNNIATGTGIYGAAFFHEIILSLKYFPFIALFLAAGAYLNKNSRNLFFLAWTNILFVCIIRMQSPSIPSYVYMAYVFTCLGLSVYLSDLIKTYARDGKSNFPDIILIITSLSAIVLLIVGLKTGIKYSSVKFFEYGYNYLKPLDIYGENSLDYPSLIKRLYSFSPLLILGSLVYVILSKSRNSIIMFALIVSLLASFLNGGLAYKKASFDRAEADFFYKTAPVLNLVPAKTFSVYVEDWNKHNFASSVLWVYRLFFDEKFQRTFEPKYKSQYLNEYQVTSNITYINREEDILSQVKGSLILTDNPNVIYTYFPKARKVEQVFPDQPGRKLVLFDISTKSIPKKVYYSLEVDLSKWKGKENSISMDEISNIMPPLEVVGVRGEFNFVYNPMAENRSVSIVLEKPHPTEQSLLLFGCRIRPPVNIPENISEVYITLETEINLTREGGENILFIQDQVDGSWDKNSIAINRRGVFAYSITRELRRNFSEVIAGINFVPQSGDDSVEFRNFKVYVWSELE